MLTTPQVVKMERIKIVCFRTNGTSLKKWKIVEMALIFLGECENWFKKTVRFSFILSEFFPKYLVTF